MQCRVLRGPGGSRRGLFRVLEGFLSLDDGGPRPGPVNKLAPKARPREMAFANAICTQYVNIPTGRTVSNTPFHCCFFRPIQALRMPQPPSPEIPSGSDRNGAATVLGSSLPPPSGAGRGGPAECSGASSFPERATVLRLIGPTIPTPGS